MKKSSFGKKLLSLFLAVVMALSCCTVALSAFGADSESNLYEKDNSYDYLGWIETTDEQKITALLDMVDEVLAAANLTPMLDEMLIGAGMPVNNHSLDIGALLGSLSSTLQGLLTVPSLEYDLNSIDGVLRTVASLENILSKMNLNIAGSTIDLGFIGSINLRGVYQGYVDNFNGSRNVLNRKENTSKEILAGIINILYMNTNDQVYSMDKNGSNLNAGGCKGGPNIQRVLAGYPITLKAVVGVVPVDITGLIIDQLNNGNSGEPYGSFYDMIGDLLGVPRGWERNSVNNIVTYLLKSLLIDPMVVDESSNFPNRVQTKTDNGQNLADWRFIDDKGSPKTLEEIVLQYLNDVLFPSILNIDGEPVFSGDYEFEYALNDSLMGGKDTMKVIQGVVNNALVPLFSTISIDFGYIPELTRMYTGWRMEQADHPTKVSDAAGYWAWNKVEEWIKKDTANIADYLVGIQDFEGNYLCQDLIDAKVKDVAAVEAALVHLFNRLDRSGANGVELEYLFTNMLYSPIANAMDKAVNLVTQEKIFGDVNTGMLNLTIRDQYFGMYTDEFVSTVAYGSTVTTSVYPVLQTLLKALFPTFTEYANISTGNALDDLVANLITTAGTLLTRVADNANKAILADTLNTAGGEVLTEANLEKAVTPLMKGAVMHAETFSQVHLETWDKVQDLNGLLFLLLSEYLSSVLPEYNYMPIAEKNGKFEAPLDTVLLPMARDCIAVIAQGIVPLQWDVYKDGGPNASGTGFKSDTDVFSLVNNIVCFFMDDLGLGALLGFSDFAVSGQGSPTHSVINMGNGKTLWGNLDLIMNRLIPVYATLFGDAEGKFNSEAFFIDTILKGVLDSEKIVDSQYGHNKRGLSAILYNFGYALFESAPLKTTPVITLAYNFLRNIINVILAPHTTSSVFADKPAIPRNTGFSPITDLIQGQVLFGSKWAQNGTGAPSKDLVLADVPSDGLLGVLVSRIADSLGATTAKTGISYKTAEGAMTKGVMNLVYIVNALLPFFPNLGQNTLHGAKASFTKNQLNQGESVSNTRLAVENPSAGLKRALMTEDITDGPNTKKSGQTERYFMKVTGVQCTNDSSLGVDLKAYVPTADGYKEVTNGLIKPTQTLFYNVTGAPSGTGAKEFKITYKVVDKNSNLYQDYDNLTTYAYMYINDGRASFIDELYDSNTGNFRQEFINSLAPSGESNYDGGKSAVKSTQLFGDAGAMAIAYPSTLVIDDANPASLEAMNIAIRNCNDDYWGSDVLIDGLYPYVIVNGVKKIMVSCDADGNLIDYAAPMEYYHPINDSWTTTPSIKYPYNNVEKDFSYTKTRYHIGVEAYEAKYLPGYEVVKEDGVVKYALINYNEQSKDILHSVTCASPINGTYVDFRDTLISANYDTTYAEAHKWLYAIPGASVGVPLGLRTIDLSLAYTDSANTNEDIKFSIDLVAQHSSKKAELENKFYQVKAFVDAHVDSDFSTTTVLSDIHNELNKAYALITAPMARTTTDATFDAEIKALNDALNAAKAAVTHEYAEDLAKNVVDKFNGYDAYDYYNINYNLTRNIKELGWNVLSREYDNPEFIEVSSKDADFSDLGTYVFKTASGEKISEENYILFLAKVAAGSYKGTFGLAEDAKEGVDYIIGYEEPRVDEWGSPIYNYSSSASVVEMKEIMRVYNLYEATMVKRGYDAKELSVRDIRTAVRNEIVCATGASDVAYVSVNADGTLRVEASKAKYGALDAKYNLSNTGAVVYTDESWQAYVDAVAAAVNASNSKTAAVSELNQLRLNVMYAENNLEEAVFIETDTYVFRYSDDGEFPGKVVEVEVEKGTPITEADYPAASADSIRRDLSNPTFDRTRHYLDTFSWKPVTGKPFEFEEAIKSTPQNHPRNKADAANIVRTEPTKTEPGSIKYYCICGAEILNSAEVIPALGVNVTLVPATLGSATITGTFTENTPVDANTTNHIYNTEYTISATPNENAKFIGWYTGGKLITTEPTYTTYAYADTVYQPVFAEKEDETFTVTFMGYCGNILKTVKSTELQAMTDFPYTPDDYPGVLFTGEWSMTLDEVKALKESKIVYAKYVKDNYPMFVVEAQGCNISVDGKAPVANKATVAFDSKVTIKPTTGTASTWRINGAVAGYGEELTFYVSADATVTYTNDVAEKGAVVAMLNLDEVGETLTGSRRVRFLASRNVPADKYELLESGFVFSQSIATEDELVLENAGTTLKDGRTIYYSKTANLSAEGQFAIIFGVGEQTNAASARAYIMYKDIATGEVYVDYSSAMCYPNK